MKNWIKITLLALIAIFMFACDDDTKTAIVRVTNVSNLDATVSFYNMYNNPVVKEVAANTVEEIVIEDGDAGLNVDGGRAIVEYYFTYLGAAVDEITETNVDLSTSIASQIEIDNTHGCMVVKNYSTNELGDMWITVDNGPSIIIPTWVDLPLFYDPAPFSSIDYLVAYYGYTMFPIEPEIVIVKEDMITERELHPDACGIWVENNSSSSNITAVNISPHYETEWGDNDLIGILYAGNWKTWVCDGEMSWDVRVIADDSENTYYDKLLEIDEILVIDFPYSSEILSNGDGINKAENAAKYEIQKANPRCEIVPLADKSISRR